MVWANLWAFLLIPCLIFLMWWWLHQKKAGALYPMSEAWRGVFPRSSHWRWVPLTLRSVLLFCLILALAQPKEPTDQGKSLSDGLDIMLVVDASGSMQALDFEWEGDREDRLTVVKRVLSEFITAREADRLGLVAFGNVALTLSPLTLDHNVLKRLLAETSIGMAGKATNIGDALATALKRLEEAPAKSRVVVLLTDGANTGGTLTPEEATDAAKALGVKVYTIAVGSNGEVPFPVPGLFGPTLSYQRVEMDEKLLKEIADATGGKMFLASDTEALREVYATIDKLEKTKKNMPELWRYRDLSAVVLWPALLVCGVELLWFMSRKRGVFD